MMVQVFCPNPDCRASYRVSDELTRHKGRCKRCGQTFSLAQAEYQSGADLSPVSQLSAPSVLLEPSSPSAHKPSPLASAAPLVLPEQFGRYRIMRRLGQGGMGSVYLALDVQLDRQVALKVPHFTPEDSPSVLDRFLREAKAAAAFVHPNLCSVFDFGQIDGVHFFTMPYIEGKPLSETIDPDKPVPERQAAAVVRKLALALDVAHQHGVVHRDLKPSNIMVNRQRELVIMDFGLARRNGADEARLTKSGAILGTPHYMAPEQVRGDVRAIGPACDIYSLGIILYELLTGRLPFDGPLTAVLGQIMLVEPEPPSKHRPGLDRRLEAICLTTTAKDPEDRYPSMGALAEALEEYLASVERSAGSRSDADLLTAAPEAEAGEKGLGDPSLPAELPVPIRIDPASSLVLQPGALARSISRGARRLRRSRLLFAGVMVLLLGGVVYVTTNHGRARTDLENAKTNARRVITNYEILLYTGTVPDAGTDSAVFISIEGTFGTLAPLELDDIPRNDHEWGSIDSYELSRMNFGDLKSLTIWHDNSGRQPGWFLDKVVVRDRDGGKAWEFPCHQWLAVDSDDRRVMRTLTPK